MRRRFKFTSVLAALAVFCAALGVGQAALVVPTGSVWSYLDDGSDQGTAWRAPGYDDSGWDSGAAELGYGDGDEVTVVGFGPDSSNKFPTTYFRHTFNLAAGDLSGINSFTLNLLRDDGAAVYLNGVPIRIDNLPALADLSFDDFNVGGPVAGTDEDTFFPSTHPSSHLVVGANTLAVEIHQDNGTSSDISFNLSLDTSTDAFPATLPDGVSPKETIPGFLNNDGDLMEEISSIYDVNGVTMFSATGTVRTWEDSSGSDWESDDFLALVLEGTQDGLNWLPLAETRFSGAELDLFDDLDDDAPGEFLPIGLMVDITQFVGDGFSRMRLVVQSDVDSGSERIEFGDISVVPEPSSIALAMLGLVGLAGYGWRRRQA